MFLTLPPLAAQSIVTARAGMVYMAEGVATIDGEPIRIQAKTTPPHVRPGQVLASARGHAEMLMGQDAVLWTGNNTQVRLDDANVDAPRVSLLSGSAILELKHTRSDRSIYVDFGNQTAEINSSGVYRLDRSPDKVRVWSGTASLQGPPGIIRRGEVAEQGSRQRFDQNDMDELHYFAAYRSLALEDAAGRFQEWKVKVAGDYKHGGFGLEFPLPIAAARAKYLAASEAGLVNFADGGIRASGRPPNIPFRAGKSALETAAGRAEIFLGLGIIARMNDHSRIRIVDTKPTMASVVLEHGELMVEVAKSAENNYLSVRLGDSVTQLHEPGLYRFDVASASLRVYGGQSTTYFGDSRIRTSGKQRIDLQSPGGATPFDAKLEDAFFHWNGTRSLQLDASASSFMVDWQPQVAPGRTKHKIFGEQANLRRGGSRRNGGPTLPRPKQFIPSISEDPRGNDPLSN